MYIAHWNIAVFKVQRKSLLTAIALVFILIICVRRWKIIQESWTWFISRKMAAEKPASGGSRATFGHRWLVKRSIFRNSFIFMKDGLSTEYLKRR